MSSKGLEMGAHAFWEKQARSLGGERWKSMVLLGGSELAADYRDQCEKRLFQKVLPLDHTMNVLDVGCGTGRWELFLASRCRKVVAFDFSQALLDIAAQKLAEIGTDNVTLVCSSLDEFETEEKFNLAIISSVLACVSDSDIAKLLQRLASIMAPEGKVFSLEFTGIRGPYGGKHGTEYLMRTREQLVELFRQAGFDLEREGYALPPVVFPSVVHRVLVSDQLKETRLMQALLRFGLCVQYSMIDPVLNRVPQIYNLFLFFKRAYPVHHRYYLYTKQPV